jgi:hypothetical protein
MSLTTSTVDLSGPCPLPANLRWHGPCSSIVEWECSPDLSSWALASSGGSGMTGEEEPNREFPLESGDNLEGSDREIVALEHSPKDRLPLFRAMHAIEGSAGGPPGAYASHHLLLDADRIVGRAPTSGRSTSEAA